MPEFATLASPYSMPAAYHGDVDLTDPADKTASRALNQFLAGVELKAFKIAQAALRHEDDALDAVQDAMLQLARAYAHRPAEEWKPLFYRILENRIRDMQRRRTVRGRVIAWLPYRGEDDDDEADPIAQAPSPEPQPLKRLELNEAIGALEKALTELPRRQQQAFLLRTLEGLDVAQTASA
ncbi:MAG TPA: RNA polymerase sigma factor, partial [Steroidobacteraceae bacterium]|nr:RNA polymerase sigma factor [Steroidobacteraceae bacterium]